MDRLERRRARFKERYANEPEFREAVKADARARRRVLYRSNPAYREKVINRAAAAYTAGLSDPVFMEKRRAYQAHMNEPEIRAKKAGTLRRLIQSAKFGAKSRGRPFLLTIKDLQSAWPADNRCPVFGVEFVVGLPRSPAKPSIDCVIPELGYVPGNIAVISWRANRLKGNGTVEEFERIAAWLRNRERT
jgi:hypothetical protein